jgi:hypothetical protein
LLDDPLDVITLRKPDPTAGPRMVDRLLTIRLLRDKVRKEVPVMGWVERALAQVPNLRGPGAILLDLVEQPAWLPELPEICREG